MGAGGWRDVYAGALKEEPKLYLDEAYLDFCSCIGWALPAQMIGTPASGI